MVSLARESPKMPWPFRIGIITNYSNLPRFSMFCQSFAILTKFQISLPMINRNNKYPIRFIYIFLPMVTSHSIQFFVTNDPQHLPRCWFQIFLIFTPNLGEDSHFDEHIFQRKNELKPPSSSHVSKPAIFQHSPTWIRRTDRTAWQTARFQIWRWPKNGGFHLLPRNLRLFNQGFYSRCWGIEGIIGRLVNMDSFRRLLSFCCF